MQAAMICPQSGRRRVEFDRRCEHCGYDFWDAAAGREQEPVKVDGDTGLFARFRRWLRGREPH